MEKTLKFKFDLNCRFAVYVPSTINVNEETDNNEQVIFVMKRLSELFGGATSTPSKGGWVCQNGDLVIETVNIVYAFCTSEQAVEKFEDVLSICEKLKREMNQEAVTLEYNGQIKFV
jgi:hypothetical protein